MLRSNGCAEFQNDLLPQQAESLLSQASSQKPRSAATSALPPGAACGQTAALTRQPAAKGPPAVGRPSTSHGQHATLPPVAPSRQREAQALQQPAATASQPPAAATKLPSLPAAKAVLSTKQSSGPAAGQSAPKPLMSVAAQPHQPAGQLPPSAAAHQKTDHLPAAAAGRGGSSSSMSEASQQAV